MWYPIAKKVKIAGADNVLQGGMTVAETLSATVEPHFYKYSVEQLPSHASIMKFLQNEVPKFVRNFKIDVEADETSSAKNMAIRELKKVESFIQKCITLYQAEPKQRHLVYPFFQELAKINAYLREFDADYSGYFYAPTSKVTDNSYWLSDILASGYNNLLNLEKLGIYFPPQFKFAIMAGLDIQAKPELKSDPLRDVMVQYIIKKYPFYERFLIKEDDDRGVIQTIQEMMNPSPEFLAEFQSSLLPSEREKVQRYNDTENDAVEMLSDMMFESGLPTEDQFRYIQAAATAPSANPKYQTRVLKKQFHYIDSDHNARGMDFLLTDLHKVLDSEVFKAVLEARIDNIPYNAPAAGLSNKSIKLMRSNPDAMSVISKLWNDVKDYTGLSSHERLVKMGFADEEATMEFARQYPRAIPSMMLKESVKAKMVKTLANEAKAAAKEAAKKAAEEAKRKKEENVVENMDDDDLYEDYWEDDEEDTSEPEPEKTNIAVPGTAAQPIQPNKPAAPKERTTPPLRRRKIVAPPSLMQTYINSNDIEHGTLATIRGGRYFDMAAKIGQSMRLDPELVQRWANVVQVYIIKNNQFEQALQNSKNTSYDTLKNTGDFLGAFTPEFSKDEVSSKRLPAIILSENKIMQQHNDTMVFKALQVPSLVSSDAIMSHEIAHALNYVATGGRMLKNEDQSGNRGRDYLTSYPEIIARVYGELPIWRTAIFQQMDNLRERDLVQEAVREEITENLMTHEAMVALGGVDPIHEYKRVEENAWPYNMAESPIEAANKRVERAKQKVQQSIMDNARLRRREILLDILKKIKYYEEQINTVAKIDGQDGVDPDHAAQYKQELMKLQKMKVLVLNGAYDLEIDSAIQSVVSNFLLRDLRNTSNSVNDPNWKPPFTLLNKDGEEIKPAYSPGTEPMNYYEIKALSKHDQDWSQGPQKGMTLEEPKMMEMEFPPNTPGYQDTFNQELEPKYKARMSFNLRRFWKS